MSFSQRLADAVVRCGNPVCVGLDPRLGQLPAELQPATSSWQAQADAYETFCRGVIDAVADCVPVVKPQAAFFEQLGPHGMLALGRVIEYAKAHGLLVIVDGKRNDIGSTGIAYARGWLGKDSPWQGDALTVSPYLGDDSLEPFAQTAVDVDAGIFVLVKTSNPGGGFLQDLTVQDAPTETCVYHRVAHWVQEQAARTADDSGYGCVGAVVGATYPEQLRELRTAMSQAWLLVPGYGAQGGGAADVAAAFDDRGLGGLINNSRGIIFAYEQAAYQDLAQQQGWQAAVRASTQRMIDDLRQAGIEPGR